MPRKPARSSRRHPFFCEDSLRAALREDPDVVLIGEMRLETIPNRPCASPKPTPDLRHAAHQLRRIDDQPYYRRFPIPSAATQVKAQLSMVMEGILCQALLPRADNRGRVMIPSEVLIPTPAIRNLVREDKIHQIDAGLPIVQCLEILASQQGKTRYFKRCSPERALRWKAAPALCRHAPIPEGLRLALREHGRGRRDGRYSRHHFAAASSHHIEKNVKLQQQLSSPPWCLPGRRLDGSRRRHHLASVEGGPHFRHIVRRPWRRFALAD